MSDGNNSIYATKQANQDCAEHGPNHVGDDIIPKQDHVSKEDALIILPRPTGGFSLDMAEPLDSKLFPNPPRPGTSSILCTIPNLQYMLEKYGIRVRYDVIRKSLQILIPGHSGTVENADSATLNQIISLATLNGMSAGYIPSFLGTIGDKHQYNPVAEWIISKQWDGIDRLPDLYDTLTEREGFPEGLKKTIIMRWLLSAVAAALTPVGFRARGVLTLQGPQSIGKTSWINALVSDPALRAQLIKLDHHLDASNKDSQLTAVGHWLVECGELDGSLRKDIARLKGFLTSDHDKIRRPYARSDSNYPRRTVFCASVNDANFLVDNTGNSRFWTLPVTIINYGHEIDMQQIFAQLKVDFKNGEQWWLTPAEERLLDEQNRKHRVVSAIYERLLDAVDVARKDEANLPAMTPTEVLRKIGIEYPTNTQSKECGAFLREYFGDPKRIQGRDRWRVPMQQEAQNPRIRSDDDF